MTIVKSKPTSPGRRFVVRVVNKDLHKGTPYDALLDKKTRSGGGNPPDKKTRRTQTTKNKGNRYWEKKHKILIKQI